MVFSECSPQLCPCGEKCENQKIQKHEWAPGLQKFMTEDKGWGVRTQQSIKSGVFILEYVGEVVSEREFKSRMATRYVDKQERSLDILTRMYAMRTSLPKM